MNKGTWVHWLLASILVLLAGVAIVAAEERIEVRVENHGGDEISVDVNGVVEVVRLDDLADGEERTFEVGDHNLVVKRMGDHLTIEDDSLGDLRGDLGTMVWMGDDGEEIRIDGDGGGQEVKKVFVMKSCCEGDGESTTTTIRIDGEDVMVGDEMTMKIEEAAGLGMAGHPHAVFVSKDGHGGHPVVFSKGAFGGDMVTYRCEETGAVLLLKKEDATADSYICPATGCLMTRVEAPEVRVIKIEKKVDVEDED